MTALALVSHSDQPAAPVCCQATPDSASATEVAFDAITGDGVETTEFAGMVRRMIRAWARRCAHADMEDLAELMAARDVLDEAIQFAVDEARRHHEWSWADIAHAEALARGAVDEFARIDPDRPGSYSRQSAEERYKPRPSAPRLRLLRVWIHKPRPRKARP